ncbi:MAG: GAF domain-containing protein [Bacteroidota bacterium]
MEFHRINPKERINEILLWLANFVLLATGVLSKLIVVKVFCLVALVIVIIYMFVRLRDKKIDKRLEEYNNDSKEKFLAKNKNEPQQTVFDDAGDFYHASNREKFEENNFNENFDEQFEIVSNEKEIEVKKSENIKTNFSPLNIEIKKVKIEKEIANVFIDLKQSELNPKQELEKILQRVVEFAHSLSFSHSAVLFWVKSEENKLALEAFATNSNNFTNQKEFSFGDDFVSNVAKSGSGILINNSNGIKLPYYENDEKIESFLAVPILYSEKSPIAILIVDSKTDDAFGNETIQTITQCAKLIADLFVAENDKLSLWDDKKYFSAHLKMLELLRSHAEIPQIVNSFVDKISEMIYWDAISVVMFNHGLNNWEVVNTRSRLPGRYLVVKQVIDLQNSLVGKSISTNELKIYDEPSQIRFMINENELEIAKGKSFAVIPISTLSKCFGAIILENLNRNAFRKDELLNIKQISATVASAIELQDANEIISQHVIHDEFPEIVTYRHFVHRLREEIIRANDLGLDLTLALFALNNANDVEERLGKESIKKVQSAIATFLVSHKRQYDLIGRMDKNIFAVLLVHTTANEAYLWGEKIRSSIAENKIKIGDKDFSTTITVAICGLKDEMTIDEILDNAQKVLDKAIRVGGNLVSVY